MVKTADRKGSAGVGSLWSKTHIGFAKGVDGSLISKEDSSGVAAILWIIPAVIDNTSWYRWPPTH